MASLDVVINPRGAQQGAAAVRQALTDIKTAARSTVDTLESGFDRLKSALFSVKTALAALGIGLAGREILETVVKVDQMLISLKAITESAEGARTEFEFVRQASNRLGLDLAATGAQYTQLLAATKGTAIAGQQTRDVFLGIAEAASVLHLSGQQTEGTLNALVQMISQGVVRSQELRLQLGNNIPGAFSIAARAMGVTTAQLNQMIEKGELLASDFLPRFGAQLRKEFSGGMEEAVNSTQANLNRFKNAIFEMQNSIGRSGFVASLLQGLEALNALLRDHRVISAGNQYGAILGGLIAQSLQLARVYGPGMAEAFLEAFKRMAIGGGRLIDVLTPVAQVIVTGLETAWNRYVDITGSVPGLTEFGLIGLLALGTKGRLAVIGGLLLMDQMIDKSKLLLTHILPGKPEEVEKVLDTVIQRWFGTGAGGEQLTRAGSLKITSDTGPAESAVKKFFADIERRSTPSITAPDVSVIAPALQPTPQEPPLDKHIQEVMVAIQEEAHLAQVKRTLTAAYGSQSVEVERAAKALEILQDLMREGKSLTFEQADAVLGYIDRLTAAKQATDNIVAAEKRYHEQTEALLNVDQSLDQDLEQARLIERMWTASQESLQVGIALLRIQQDLKQKTITLDEGELTRLREKLTLIEQTKKPPIQQIRADAVLVEQAKLDAATAGYASFEDLARQRVKVLDAQYAQERNQANLTAEQILAIDIRHAAQRRQQVQLTEGGVLEIYKYGLQEYLTNTGNTFNIAVDMARSTAEAMSQGFKSFFVDVLKGQMTDVKTILTGVRDFAYNIIAEVAARLATAGLLRQIEGSLFFQNLGSTNPRGVDTAGTFTTASPGPGSGLIVQRYGGIMPLEHYDQGGIAQRPQMALFGEGSQSEAYVPLPDGRSIPVTLRMPRTATAPAMGQPVVNQISIEVFNQHKSASVQTSQRRGPDGRLMIRMLIKETTQDLLRSGDLDRDMENQYGLTRRGATR